MLMTATERTSSTRTRKTDLSPHAHLLPGALVHRRQLTEVLLTALERTSDSTFVAHVHWPRRHAYFGPWGTDDVAVGPALALETLRQTAIALAHLHLGVPFGQAFVMESMRVEVADDAVRRSDRPGSPTIDVVVSELVERKGVAASYDSMLTVRDGDHVLARGGGRARTIPGPVYRRMREGAPSSADVDRLPPRPSPAAHGLVGAPTPDFVLLSGAAGSDAFELSLDATNPVYFDHPLDHVPGMVVLEAALQAFRAHADDPTHTPREVTVEFLAHAELTSPVTITLEREDGTEVAVLCQDGVVVSRVRASAFPG
ncbi:hypothetical protein DEI92_09860 [Curtobacterium sp. MCBD17_034]|nr:hypothetical protein DEI92_09860 [Curtobacterium sp. MCBD17_034]PZM34179.1 hypothetical protein DEI90_08275 [Curtobacterium sp. MCBD17_031]